MRALAVPTEILLTFKKNRSRHLKKSLSLAKKADHFTEKDDQIGCKFTRAPDSPGRLYYLLRALWHSHRFRTVEVGLGDHLLTEREINELWDTLSCYIDSRRFKNIRNHCDCLWRSRAGELTLGGDETEVAILVPCRRAFFARPSSTARRDVDSFLDLARAVFADYCPLFKPELFRKVAIDEWGNVAKDLSPQIESKTKKISPPSRRE